MSSAVLLINADYTPLRPIPWERAITLVLEEKANVVEEYAGKMIRSASETWPWPAVIRLVRQERVRTRIKFSRANILARDNYTCCYCGVQPKAKDGRPRIDDLTYDHVVPRAHGRDNKVRLPWNGKTVDVSCWENAATACYDCNSTKADRTPEQAGMKMLFLPKRPSPFDVFRMSLRRVKIPMEWAQFLPDSAQHWAGYWDAELES